jgi:hypothetical protein
MPAMYDCPAFEVVWWVKPSQADAESLSVMSFVCRHELGDRIALLFTRAFVKLHAM